MFIMPPKRTKLNTIHSKQKVLLTDGNIGPVDALLTRFSGDTHDCRFESGEKYEGSVKKGWVAGTD